MKHTPGPWEYFQGQICFGKPEERGVICSIDDRVSEEDCLLMAAAPELLSVAQFIVQATTGNIPPGIVQAAQDAIKKAVS